MATPQAPGRGGYFDRGGRQSAIFSSLPLLGTYFSRGLREKLREAESGILRSDGESSLDHVGLEQAVAGLRFRVALAAGEGMVGILESVLDRPNFRYGVRHHESVGALAGKLDVTRWVSRKWEVRAHPIYPVLRVERSSRTPENLLACYSLLWITTEIEEASVAAKAPTSSREMKAASALLERLDAMMAMPEFSEHRLEVAHAGSREWAFDILEDVERRLSSGHVGNREPYELLATWVRRTMSGNPTLQSGEAEWLFYDETFDATLFELWCLMAIGDAISELIAQDRQIPDMCSSSQVPAYHWPVGDFNIAIHFQYDLINTSIDKEVTWKRDAGTLGGRPDITAVVSTQGVDGQYSVVYIDPKLRKRNQVPTEEIYKMLGYFSNSGIGNAGWGAILFYTPHQTPQPIYDFTSDQGGRVVAVGVDPARPEQNGTGLATLAKMILARTS